MGSTVNVPIDKLFIKTETTNYCRIILLMVDVGTEILRLLFYSRVPKHTVKGYLDSKKSDIKMGKRNRIFDKSQYTKLTNPDPNPDEFDMSLLIKLLNYFMLSPVKLDDLQKLRNEIVGHKCRAESYKQEFESLWVKVETILLNIAKCVGGNEEQITKVKITELKEKVLDVSDREKKIIKVFETWYNVEILTLQKKIDRNIQNTETLKTKLKELRVKRKEDQHPQCKHNELQQDLISYYRRLFGSLQISPLIEEDGFASSFFDLYVKPILTIPIGPGAQVQPTPVETIHDIFVANSKPCSRVFISSPAGCGKTSFAKYLALIWCQAHMRVKSNDNCCIAEDIDEMKTFELLFFVFLRDEHERECDVDIMIQNQLLPKLGNSAKYAEKGLAFLQKLINSVKCIIILDGLDEWSHPPENGCTLHNKLTPYIRDRQQCTILTTSRPWKLDVVRLKPEEIDRKLELKGLENDLLHSLIRNVVNNLSESRGKEMQAYKDLKADDFEQELRDKKLTELSKIPVVVMQLLTVWFDNKPLGKSQCEIYSNVIEFLLERYCKKRKIDFVMEDSEVDDRCRGRETPMCLQNQMYCKAHIELLSKLAKLAFDRLFTDTHELSLTFDKTIAKQYLTDTHIEMSLAIGILTQEKVIDKISTRQSHISFMHKTFQEYFAALYVALSPNMGTNLQEKIKCFCCSIETIMEMSQIFMFLSGLCPKIMVKLSEHLRQTVSEDSGTQRYRASCELEAWSSEGETLKQIQKTMMEWLCECWLNGHQDVTHFPVSDFFIRFTSPQLSAELQSLTVHNPVRSLFVDGTHYSPERIEAILNYVTVFNSIQKLWLFGVTEAFVVQLVYQHKYSLSVRPETWRHLRCVTLTRMKIPGDILYLLVDSILKLPKSVQVRLEKCTISQGTSDCNAYIRSHPRLTVDVDSAFYLQFHINKV